MVLSGTALGGNCPAFTAAMVDAAAMTIRLPGPHEIGTGYLTVSASEDPTSPDVSCRIAVPPSAGGNTFEVDVNYYIPNAAFVFGRGVAEDTPNYDTALSSYAEELSVPEMHACRSEVLNSFVWKNYCAPERGPFEN